MNEPKHTPTPWIVAGQVTDTPGYCETRHIYSPADRNAGGTGCVATVRPSMANAAFIVRACNAHDALVEALVELLYLADDPETQDDDEMAWSDRVTSAIHDAKTALRKAGVAFETPESLAALAARTALFETPDASNK